MDFVHLHVHSHYSLLDALPKIDELVDHAKKLGYKSLALTDHGNMYGTIEFYEACQKAGIKPIIGMEAYLVVGSRFDKNNRDEKIYHQVLLAENNIGYKNLMKLASLASLEGFSDKPRLDKELLKQYHEGLVALSGCFAGEIPTILQRDDNFDKAKNVALEYQEIFGKDNFYLELMDLPALEGQMDMNTKLIQLSAETGIPMVVTRDSHYLEEDEAEAQDVLTCIRDGKTMDEDGRATMNGVDYSLAPAKEIINRFKHVPEAISNTVKIADRANVTIELNKWHFPHLNIPDGKTVDEYLREQVYEKLPKRIEMTEEVKKRADYELDIIAKKGYSPYFLTVADYINYAREHRIMVTTRGSAAGSVVSFAMGIVMDNPLYFKLPFERFLNPFRPSPPDIDGDFADDRRDEMIAYVTKKYGADKVAQIITFGTMAARGSVRDVGRALGYSYSFCDQISKLIPFGAQGFQMTIAKALTLEPELKKLYDKNAEVKRLLDLAQKVEGCARHTSIHAAGVVISPTPLTDFTPVQLETGGDKIVTQYEMHSVETAGVLKMDFLGIRNLSILGNAVEIIEKTTDQKINVYNLYPWNDAKTYDMLARGETVGVFQLASSGMTRYLKELKPSSIFDIMAMVALFRPGPMDSIPDYILRKNNHDLIEYEDPRMKDYLDQSLGLIVYQDDVLLTAINLAGYNWEEADKFRKAMGKKIPEEMAKQKEKFFKGAKEFGKLTSETINKLWERIEPFAAYGFNKAHAASYAVVAYQTAYLKANFPVQYMTAVLIAESGDIDKVPEIIHECERMGVKVLPPDINESFKSFAMTPIAGSQERLATGQVPSAGTSVIRFGLNGIKNLGENIAEAIYQERKANGKFKDLQDFLTRVKDKDLNKKSLESLAKCGALDGFGYDRGVLLANMENILSFSKQIKEGGANTQHSLFSGTSLDAVSVLKLVNAKPANEADKLTWEKELLGFYITSHPFKAYQEIMKDTLIPLKDLSAQPRNQWVVVGGMLDSTKKKITRSGKAMMFAKLLDTTSSLELLVFPKTYETTAAIWVEGRPVCVIGRTSEEEGDDKLFVEKAYVLTKENAATLAKQMSFGKSYETKKEPEPISFAFEIAVSPEQLKSQAEAIKNILSQYPGDEAVILKVGDKIIRTSYRVDGSEELRNELATIVSN